MPASKENPKFSALAAMIADADKVSIETELEKNPSSGATDGKCSCGADLVCADCNKPPSQCDC